MWFFRAPRWYIGPTATPRATVTPIAPKRRDSTGNVPPSGNNDCYSTVDHFFAVTTNQWMQLPAVFMYSINCSVNCIKLALEPPCHRHRPRVVTESLTIFFNNPENLSLFFILTYIAVSINTEWWEKVSVWYFVSNSTTKWRLPRWYVVFSSYLIEFREANDKYTSACVHRSHIYK